MKTKSLTKEETGLIVDLISSELEYDLDHLKAEKKISDVDLYIDQLNQVKSKIETLSIVELGQKGMKEALKEILACFFEKPRKMGDFKDFVEEVCREMLDENSLRWYGKWRIKRADKTESEVK